MASCRVRGDQLHRVDRREHVPRRHGRRADEQGRSAVHRGLHVRQGHRLLQLVLGGRTPDACGPPEQDKGPADFDVRQKLALSANWTLPSPGGGMLRAFAGGWQLAGVLVAQTGTPFSVVCNNRGFIAVLDSAGRIVGNSGCDYNADNFLANDRPNVPSFGDSRGGLRMTIS